MGDGEPHPAAGLPRPGRCPRLRRPVRRRGPSGSTWGLVSAASRGAGWGWGVIYSVATCVLLLVWGWGCERHRYPQPWS